MTPTFEIILHDVEITGKDKNDTILAKEVNTILIRTKNEHGSPPSPFRTRTFDKKNVRTKT